MREAEVIVRRDIQRLRRLAREGEGRVVVGRGAVKQGRRPSGNGRDGPREAVVNSELESSGVETVEIWGRAGVRVSKLQCSLDGGGDALTGE